MWTENTYFLQDLEFLSKIEYIPWEQLKKSTILITGATGLIGFNLVSGLAYVDLKNNLDIKIIALVRDKNKASEKYSALIEDYKGLNFIEGSVENLPTIEESIDYVIHGASPTASLYFVEHPVETIKTAVNGTMNLLSLATKKQVKGFVYLSSMEIYGAPKTEEVLSEKDLGYMDPLNVRNCYPESKRLCESLCASFAQEYNLPVMSVRLAQTFGLGVSKDDVRVFAEFARCAMRNEDIVLLTDGKSKRCYLYTMDAVTAILTVLLKGESGQAYNAGNPATYCSIREMADLVVGRIASKSVKVVISDNKEECKKFPPPHFYNLGILAIEKLGWKPDKELEEMYQRMISGFEDGN